MDFHQAIKNTIEHNKKHVLKRMGDGLTRKEILELLRHEMTINFSIRLILIEAGENGELKEMLQDWQKQVTGLHDQLIKEIL